MRTLWKTKLASIIIALLLVLTGCSNNSVPATTTPTKVEESNQLKSQEQIPADKTDNTASNTSDTSSSEKTSEPIVDPPKSAPSSAPTQPTVTPSPEPKAQPVVAPAPAPSTPPVVTPTPAPKPTNQTVTVYITKTGEKHHSDGCRYLSKSKIPISLSDAKLSYDPCSVCNPPR